MSKKKSYMDMTNILSEGILKKLFNWALNRKVKKVGKQILKDPAISKAKKNLENSIDKFEKVASKADKEWDKYIDVKL